MICQLPLCQSLVLLGLLARCTARRFGCCQAQEVPLYTTVNLTEVLPTLPPEEYPSYINKTVSIWGCEWHEYLWSLAPLATPGLCCAAVFAGAMLLYLIWYWCCCFPKQQRWFESVQRKNTTRFERLRKTRNLEAMGTVLSVITGIGVAGTWVGFFLSNGGLSYGLNHYDDTLEHVNSILDVVTNATGVLELTADWIRNETGLAIPDWQIHSYVAYLQTTAANAWRDYRDAKDTVLLLYRVGFAILLAISMIGCLMVFVWYVHSLHLNWNRRFYKVIVFILLLLGCLLSIYIGIQPVLIAFFTDACEAYDYIVYGVGDDTGLYELLGCVPGQDSSNVLWDQIKELVASELPIQEAVCNATTGCTPAPFPAYCSGLEPSGYCEWWAQDSSITDLVRDLFTTLDYLINYGLSLLSCAALKEAIVDPTESMCTRTITGLSVSLAGTCLALLCTAVACVAACLLTFEVLAELLGREIPPPTESKNPTVRYVKMFLRPAEAPSPVNDPRIWGSDMEVIPWEPPGWDGAPEGPQYPSSDSVGDWYGNGDGHGHGGAHAGGNGCSTAYW